MNKFFLLLLLIPSSAFALVEYSAVDTLDRQDTIAISKSFEEINEYAKKHNGGMIFQDKDTKEYTYIPSTINLNGAIYYYTNNE